MGKFLQRLARDCKGAVTVFVTLLLIPAVLVSGTAVDLARVHTARSVLHDANQLAANSVLASYDALLQDLYGLYGVMKDDPEFAAMVDEYIRVAVLGEDWQNKDLGTFQLFYGSELTTDGIKPAPDKNLSNQQVLRRQIEEYAKFRAPTIIVTEILDRLDTFGKVQEDAGVIKDKMEIDDKIEEIDKLYSQIYECIQIVDSAKEKENAAIESVNAYVKEIEQQIDKLYETRSDYTEAYRNDDMDTAEDYLEKYKGLVKNIHSLIVGGEFREGWIPGGLNDQGEYEKGYWVGKTHKNGLNKSIGDRIRELEDLISNGDGKANSLTELLALCKEADSKRAELGRMVDELEKKLNSGKCSNDLKNGLTKPSDGNDAVIDTYRKLLSEKLEPMAQAMLDHDKPQIQGVIDLLKNEVGYGNPKVGVFYSRDYLKNLDVNDIPIDLIITNEAMGPGGKVPDKLAEMDGVTPMKFKVTGTFEPFGSTAFSATQNPQFYQKLKEMYGSSGNGVKKKNIVSGLEKMAGQIQKQFSSLLEFDPLGARYYKAESDASPDTETNFGQAGDWGDSGGAKSQVKQALNNNLIGLLGETANGAANKVLLLTYASEMFSCYATNSGETEDEPVEKNMNGIPLGVDVNYYFQSELEYLYHGNLGNAKDNLAAVTGMMFLVRFVFNYIASFTVSDVKITVNSVKTALAATGPFAVVAGELVRMVLALGESVIDVSRLKDGCQVSIFKTNQTWQFSLSGQLDKIGDGVVGELSASSLVPTKREDDPAPSMGYKDYMRLFLMLMDGDTLAQRTAKLIELNVTNKREGFGSLGSQSEREKAMGEAELFQMSNAITDFSITTNAELKMLFLSMPFAQKGVNGVVPPGSLEVSVTDYRGY